MNGAEATKTVQESKVVLAQHMGVSDSNLAGAVHGGTIMKLVDTAGGLAATKFCGNPVVTAAIDELSFLEPVNLGDLVTVTASVNGVGDTSMEVGVKVETENVMTGERRHTSTAYLLYVAMDPEAKQPVRVPRLVCETPEERRRQRQAKARRKARIARRESALKARSDAEETARKRREAAESRRKARLAAKKDAGQPDPAAREEPAAEQSSADVKRWRSRLAAAAAARADSEEEPAMATAGPADPATDLSRWRRRGSGR